MISGLGKPVITSYTGAFVDHLDLYTILYRAVPVRPCRVYPHVPGNISYSPRPGGDGWNSDSALSGTAASS